MTRAVKILVIAGLVALTASCKSSCDCFKHSYGQQMSQDPPLEQKG